MKLQRNNSNGRKTRQRTGWLIVSGVLFLLAAALLAVAAWQYFNPNEEVQTTLPSGTSLVQAQENEGVDESDVSESLLSQYKVAEDLPRAVYIDKLNVASRVLPMGLNKDSSIQAPVNIFDTGWYTESAKPDEVGATFIDGHASGATRQGIFAYLDTLAIGDTIQVEKGNGERLSYRVVHTETVPYDTIDMQKVLQTYGDAEKGLNLMTCTGTWVAKKATYDKRVIVYTEQV